MEVQVHTPSRHVDSGGIVEEIRRIPKNNPTPRQLLARRGFRAAVQRANNCASPVVGSARLGGVAGKRLAATYTLLGRNVHPIELKTMIITSADQLSA